MFPFWHDVVAPLIEAAEARRIVEIGALRGENTELMLQRLGPDVELHVIDPVPNFDPSEHEERFAGQYVFHRDLSVNVLPDLAPMDVALIDGDHNWYTVFTEMTMLADVARRAGALMPLMILHDVGWPYGRRDLYYDPSNIPSEQQQPWRQGGMRRGEEKLLPRGGGMNANLAHAEIEGGPRNGVMTGVDDFIAGYDKPLRLVVLPIFFGLAIVVEEERLTRQPALASTLEWLDTPDGKDMLLRLGENIRVDAVTFDQAMLKQATDRVESLSDRYLETITRGIVAEASAATGPSDAQSVRASLDHLRECLDTGWAAYLRGELVVVGAGTGAAATFLAAFLEARDPDPRPRLRRKLWIAGTSPLDATREMLDRFDLLSDRARLLDGAIDTALDEVTASPLALIHLGTDSGADAAAALDLLYPRLTTGGLVVIDDISDTTMSAAVDAYRAQHDIDTPIERVGSAAHWRNA